MATDKGLLDLSIERPRARRHIEVSPDARSASEPDFDPSENSSPVSTATAATATAATATVAPASTATATNATVPRATRGRSQRSPTGNVTYEGRTRSI